MAKLDMLLKIAVAALMVALGFYLGGCQTPVDPPIESTIHRPDGTVPPPPAYTNNPEVWRDYGI